VDRNMDRVRYSMPKMDRVLLVSLAVMTVAIMVMMAMLVKAVQVRVRLKGIESVTSVAKGKIVAIDFSFCSRPRHGPAILIYRFIHPSSFIIPSIFLHYSFPSLFLHYSFLLPPSFLLPSFFILISKVLTVQSTFSSSTTLWTCTFTTFASVRTSGY
jgi:hypothetical protein